jgi:hypothetical protein
MQAFIQEVPGLGNYFILLAMFVGQETLCLLSNRECHDIMFSAQVSGQATEKIFKSLP